MSVKCNDPPTSCIYMGVGEDNLPSCVSLGVSDDNLPSCVFVDVGDNNLPLSCVPVSVLEDASHSSSKRVQEDTSHPTSSSPVGPKFHVVPKSPEGSVCPKGPLSPEGPMSPEGPTSLKGFTPPEGPTPSAATMVAILLQSLKWQCLLQSLEWLYSTVPEVSTTAAFFLVLMRAAVSLVYNSPAAYMVLLSCKSSWFYFNTESSEFCLHLGSNQQKIVIRCFVNTWKKFMESYAACLFLWSLINRYTICSETIPVVLAANHLFGMVLLGKLMFVLSKEFYVTGLKRSLMQHP